MAESSNDNWSPVYCGGSEDQDFEPSAEMLVHEFDEEQTMEDDEEENPDSERTFSSEVEDLEREGEMPLEELLVAYGYGPHLVNSTVQNGESPGSQLTVNLPEMTLDKEEIAKDLLSGEDDESQSSADDLMPSVIGSEGQDIFTFQLGSEHHDLSDDDEEDDEEDEEDDEDEIDEAFIPSEENKKVMIGSQYQANIPLGLCTSEEDSSDEFRDELIWRPGLLPEYQIKEYLLQATGMEHEIIHKDALVHDNEQVLLQLLKCNFDVKEALNRLRVDPPSIKDEMVKWTEEEQQAFEAAFCLHGKDFRVIHMKVVTKTVAECVSYYYTWKKSDHYDDIMQQSRFGRRRLVPPSLIDFESLGLDSCSTAHDRFSLPWGFGRRERNGLDGSPVGVTAEMAAEVLESLSASELAISCPEVLLLRGSSLVGPGTGTNAVLSPSPSPGLGPFLPPSLPWDSEANGCLAAPEGDPLTPDSVAHSTSSLCGEDQEVPAKALKLDLEAHYNGVGGGPSAAVALAVAGSRELGSNSPSATASSFLTGAGMRLAVNSGEAGCLLSAHLLHQSSPVSPESCSQ
uniref:mesoderm induction early response protein 3-like n=1 Tax=Myxine glutinosa TaxID=7769 RepID=UPI00358E984C